MVAARSGSSGSRLPSVLRVVGWVAVTPWLLSLGLVVVSVLRWRVGLVGHGVLAVGFAGIAGLLLLRVRATLALLRPVAAGSLVPVGVLHRFGRWEVGLHLLAGLAGVGVLVAALSRLAGEGLPLLD